MSSPPYIITAYKKQISKSISHVIAQIREFEACVNPKCNPRLQVQVFPHITVHIKIHSTCLKQIAPMQIPNEHHLHCKIQEHTLNPKDILGQRTHRNKECSCHIWNHGGLQNRHEIFHNLRNKKMQDMICIRSTNFLFTSNDKSTYERGISYLKHVRGSQKKTFQSATNEI